MACFFIMWRTKYKHYNYFPVLRNVNTLKYQNVKIMLVISELFIYPIKSLGGIMVDEAVVTDRGLQHDRRFMLVDQQNRFLTQREHPQMALLKTAISNSELSIFHVKNKEDQLIIPWQLTEGETVQVTVWEDTCEALLATNEINKWFCEKLLISCKLVFMPDISRRNVDARYARTSNDITSFSDAYPILMISQASLDYLNEKLAEPMPMNRFRPNIVFTGGTPHVEDSMQRFRIDEVSYSGVKLCGRCVVTTTDQGTAARAKEPLRTLASYRTINNKVCFGQNVISHSEGRISIGQEIIQE